MKSLPLFLTLLATTMLIACSGAKESKLTGCYALKEGGRPELKITKSGGEYFVAVREGQEWSNPEGLHPANISELKPLFGDDSARIKASLVADKGAFGIFLVNSGEVYGGERAKSDYFAFIFFGGGSVYKVRCN